ncbi:NADP-dependent 3-hydroxy acid dehydrogenase YdfG [Methylobacterium sp. UNC300MFChir4.1]|jgi:NAD(P)-dependent dehydrogenase (short-subunit alcohol dehydrogenase family)|uniref:SDR family oxidoreductase n=1 Tax=Methylobacterium sp. UNC300MFChir4.1 TaxID=1502747 RepID=UPI0008C95002|nr:SDR family oxidoreductase [Methylobacterium sp. UNC300MFChir4.1]SEO73953.1 NADP-dependent 3-hydroxy acid dehydrogenase YdfG [Methylobacterium sp. UNC300MFChir4.1]
MTHEKRQHRHPTVVVTGGSAGVGRAIAHEFARHGWNVAVLARGEAGLNGTVRDIERAGGRALAHRVDVADADAVMRAADRTVEEFGAIDVWVNVAMVTIYAPVQETTPDEFKRATEVTYLGQVYGTLAALKHMQPHNAGAIVCIGSALAYRSIPLQASYCAGKAAIRGFLDSLRSELLHDGSRVRLTMVQLPAVNTPQFDWARTRMPRRLEPVPPIYQPEAIARHVYRAAQTMPRELWIGVPTWKAIIGNMIIPGWIDGYLARHGYRGEMTSQAALEGRPDNLDRPVDTDPGAHGRFDGRALPSVPAADPRWLKLGLAAALGAAFVGAVAVARATEPPRRLR